MVDGGKAVEAGKYKLKKISTILGPVNLIEPDPVVEGVVPEFAVGHVSKHRRVGMELAVADAIRAAARTTVVPISRR